MLCGCRERSNGETGANSHHIRTPPINISPLLEALGEEHPGAQPCFIINTKLRGWACSGGFFNSYYAQFSLWFHFLWCFFHTVPIFVLFLRKSFRIVHSEGIKPVHKRGKSAFPSLATGCETGNTLLGGGSPFKPCSLKQEEEAKARREGANALGQHCAYPPCLTGRKMEGTGMPTVAFSPTTTALVVPGAVTVVFPAA